MEDNPRAGRDRPVGLRGWRRRVHRPGRPADRFGQVRGDHGEIIGGHRPSLPLELADGGGHVDGDVEDHAVGQQAVELQELLLLGGSLAASAPRFPKRSHLL
jgi:hypothetical protein